MLDRNKLLSIDKSDIDSFEKGIQPFLVVPTNPFERSNKFVKKNTGLVGNLINTAKRNAVRMPNKSNSMPTGILRAAFGKKAF